MDKQYGRMVLRRVGVRPLVLASVVVAGLLWIDWLVTGTEVAGVPYPVWCCVLLGVNIPLTMRSPRCKRAVVAAFQRFLLNPPVRLMLRLGIPLGWCLLETTGRRTGRRRVVPVGNGLMGDQLWIIAEHGDQAGYVRNIRADPRVRVRLWRRGRLAWVVGTATVLDDDEPWARQRWLVGWRHPLRFLNAMVVRVLGTRLLTIRVDLERPEPGEPAPLVAHADRGTVDRSATASLVP